MSNVDAGEWVLILTEVLTVLLNGGTCPSTGAQILKKETVDLMLSNSIEKFPNFSRQPIPAAKPDLTNPIGELYPVDGNPPQVRRSLPFPAFQQTH